MRIVYGAVFLLVMIAILVFCVQNMETVNVTYLKWSATVPMPALIFVVYVFGMASGWTVVTFLRQLYRRAVQAPD